MMSEFDQEIDAPTEPEEGMTEESGEQPAEDDQTDLGDGQEDVGQPEE